MPTASELARQEIARRYSLRNRTQVPTRYATVSAARPTIRSALGNLMRDAIDATGVGGGYRQGLLNAAGGIESAVDFLPVAGDAIAVDEASQALGAGDWIGAGINMLGAIPVVGDVAAKGVKSALRGLDAGGNLVQKRMLIPDVEEGRRRLYNAGTIDRNPQGYLEPHISDWVKEVAESSGYEGNVEDITKDLVYMSEKPDWVRMIIARDIGKDVADVTLDDVRRYGRLNIIDAEIDADEIFQIGDYSESGKIKDLAGNQRNLWDTTLYDDENFSSIPIGPEPDDFISNQPQEITYTLTGDDLVDFLNENQPDMMQSLKGSASSSGKSALRGLAMNTEARMQRAKDLGFGPETYYHASTSDIDEFKPKYDDGLTFITPNPEFANKWLGKGGAMSKLSTASADSDLYKQFKKERQQIWQKYADQYGDDFEKWPEAESEKMWKETSDLRKQYDATDQVVYPLRTNVQNTFDPRVDEETIIELLRIKGLDPQKTTIETGKTNLDVYKSGNYLLYEDKDTVDFLRSKGYDSMLLKESVYDDAFDTLGIFDPKNIRSTNAEFDPAKADSADLLSSVGTTSALRNIA